LALTTNILKCNWKTRTDMVIKLAVYTDFSPLN
jgi:hypothetical protein